MTCEHTCKSELVYPRSAITQRRVTKCV